MWESIVGLAIKIILMFLDSNKDKKESRAAFLKFVEAMEKEKSKSAGIRKSYKNQIERLKNGPK